MSVGDIAALAGVFVGPVSNVLNRPKRVAKQTIESVQRTIEALGFVRNDAARQPRAGHSRSSGLIVLDVSNPFFTDVARHQEARSPGQADTRSFSSVAVDDVAAGNLTANHLISIGRRRIAFVGRPHTIRPVADRLSGAKRTVACGKNVSLESIDTESLTIRQGHIVGQRILKRAVSERPDALFAENDLLALGILKARNDTEMKGDEVNVYCD